MRPALTFALTTLALAACRPSAPGSAPQQNDLLAARTHGSATAPVTVYEISDFQCPYCAQFYLETMPLLEREYVVPGKAKFVFVNLPLPMHPNAVPAAELAMCAAQQGKFWPMHDVLFRNQRQWAGLGEPGQVFLAYGDSVGANREALASCVRDGTMREVVRTDAEGGVRSGAHSTPTFYIEGGLIVGAQPVETFRAVLDSIVRAKGGTR
jgi:protein-disulfide isomerase